MFHGSTTPELKARGSNWKAHTEGVTRLIEIRGPRACTGENARLLFLDSRLSAVRNGYLQHDPLSSQDTDQ